VCGSRVMSFQCSVVFGFPSLDDAQRPVIAHTSEGKGLAKIPSQSHFLRTIRAWR